MGCIDAELRILKSLEERGVHRLINTSIKSLLVAMTFYLSSSLFALTLQFPNPSIMNFYAKGYCDLRRSNSAKPIAGNFCIAYVNNSLNHLKFDPVTTCAKSMNHCDEFIVTPKCYAYIIGEGQDEVRNRLIEPFAYVRRLDQPLEFYMDFSSMYFRDSFEFVEVLSSIGTSGTITHIRDNLYRNHCLKDEVIIERFIDFEVDDKGRITSATVSFLHNLAYPMVPSFLLNMTYRDDDVFPHILEVKYTKEKAKGRRYFWRFDELIQDQNIEYKIKPTLLTAKTTVHDVRFTPRLVYKSKGTEFPSEEELFRIAAVKKAEKEAQEKQTAAAKDPRNIPPSAPVVKESYLKYLRQIPNWAYVSLLGVAIIGWVLARASCRKE